MRDSDALGVFFGGVSIGLVTMAFFLGWATKGPTTITPARILRAQEACAPNGGLKEWHGTRLECSNGAVFTVD